MADVPAPGSTRPDDRRIARALTIRERGGRNWCGHRRAGQSGSRMPRPPRSPTRGLDSAGIGVMARHCDLGSWRRNGAQNKPAGLVVQSYNRVQGRKRPGAPTDARVLPQGRGPRARPAGSDHRRGHPAFIDGRRRLDRLRVAAAAAAGSGRPDRVWKNTRRRNAGHRELTLAKAGDAYEVSASGAAARRATGDDSSVHHFFFLGPAVLSTPANGRLPGVYEFDFSANATRGEPQQGLLISLVTRPRRDGRSSYFLEEFFYASGADGPRTRQAEARGEEGNPRDAI